MKYLCFDLECANCFNGEGKICEFGYVLADSRLNVLEKEVFLINPLAEFDWHVAKKMLAFDVSEYKKAKTYKCFFNRIRRLLEDPDTVVLGHTLADADVKYLNSESKRYGLPYLKYTFYDLKTLYQQYANAKDPVGLSKLCDCLGVLKPEHEHKSDDDALATLMAFKAVADRLEVDLDELLTLCPHCKGSTSGGQIKFSPDVVFDGDGEREFSAKLGYFDLLAYAMYAKERNSTFDSAQKISQTDMTTSCSEREADAAYCGSESDTAIEKDFNRLDVEKDGSDLSVATCDTFCEDLNIGERYENNGELANKRVSFSLSLERTRLKDMLVIADMLARAGAEYVFEADKSDLFVSDAQPSRRLFAAEKTIADGNDMRIISFEELLALLGVTQSELAAAPVPDAASEVTGKYKKRKRKPLNYVNADGASSIGDIIKSKRKRHRSKT